MKIFEKKLFLLKYFGLFIGLFTAFLQPNFFNRFFTEDEFALLILIFGLSTYLIFFDGGISKPLYPNLRDQFINGLETGSIVKKIVNFYNVVFLSVFTFFTLVILLLSTYYDNTFPVFFFILLSFYISLNLIISYYKNILNALDLYIPFETVEIIRKSLNIVVLLLLFVDSSFILSFLVGCAISILLYLYVLLLLVRQTNMHVIDFFTLNKKEVSFIFSKYFTDSYQYFQFSINEILIYNSGFILIPIFLSSFEVIEYGLWMRIFIGVSLFTRAISDISIHAITKKYFAREMSIVKQMMRKLFILSTVMVFLFASLCLVFNDTLFLYWVDEKYKFDLYLNIALIIMIFSNAYQHIAGTFLLAIGGNFMALKRISFILLLIIIFVQIILIVIFKDLSIVLFATSMIYLLGMFYYLHLLRSKL